MKIYFWLPLLFLISLLCSCGQMGALYLPGTSPPIHVKNEKIVPSTDTQKTTSEQPTPSTQ
jgi:predicted small lipoprotein YifL